MKFIIALLVIAIGLVAFAKDVAKDAKPIPKKTVAAVQKKLVHDKVKVDRPLSTAELAEVDAWVKGKVKSGAMTQKQGDDAMKYAASLKKVMDSEKKPKKGDKNGN